MIKNSREDLITRRKKFGNLGCLDFLIKYCGESKNLYDNKLLSGLGIENIDFSDYTMPLRRDVRRYARKREDGKAIPRNLFKQALELSKDGLHALSPDTVAELIDTDFETFPEAYLLVANYFVSKGDSQGWLNYANKYFEKQGVSPLEISGGTEKELFYQITSTPKRYIHNGPKVSVIIPCFNAEKTIQHSIKSMLNQSWRNLEIIAIDDASSDGTWNILKSLSETDDRLIVRRNSENAGPYVAKNLALTLVSGEYITGHDADDWSHPERIERQIGYMQKYKVPVNMSFMVRMYESGYFSHLGNRTDFSPDGALRKASISCMFEKTFFVENLGSWDCVRFGADSEIISRTKLALGRSVLEAPFTSMLCLDLETSLTNHPEYGIDKSSGIKAPRVEYRDAWESWHKSLGPKDTHLRFNYGRKIFKAPKQALVEASKVQLLNK